MNMIGNFSSVNFCEIKTKNDVFNAIIGNFVHGVYIRKSHF